MKSARIHVSAVLIALSLALTSCSEGSSPVAPEVAAPPQVQSDAELLGLLSPVLNKVGLLQCRALPEAYATARIGSEGGTIRVGPHTLTIPRGALDRTVTITAYAPSSRNNRVEFAPHGLEFDRPASLTMSYANCDVLGSLLPKHIAYVNDRLRILYLLESVDNLLQQRVTGRLDHFSEYALAW